MAAADTDGRRDSRGEKFIFHFSPCTTSLATPLGLLRLLTRQAYSPVSDEWTGEMEREKGTCNALASFSGAIKRMRGRGPRNAGFGVVDVDVPVARG